MKNAQALRAARNARLASSKTSTAPAAQSQSSLKTPNAEPATPVAKPAAAPKAPAVTATPVVAAAAPPVEEPARELVARVVDPARIGAESSIQVSGPFNTKTANPHWLVLVDGEPFSKIALSDQENKEQIAKVFVTEAYASGIRAGISKMPLDKVMTGVNARPYIAAVRSTEAFAAVESKAKEAAQVAFQRKSAQYRDDLMSMLNLAVEAQTRNYTSHNPLKDAFYKAMRSAGVHDPVPLIEAAYAEAAPAHFEALFHQASRWQDFAPEALADVKQEILRMPGRAVRTAAPADSRGVASPPKPVPSSANNVPFVASTGNAPLPDEKAKVRSAFNFRQRLLSKSIRPK